MEHETFAPQDFETIARLSSVDAAKKQIPPIPPKQLLAISIAARAMPHAAKVQASDMTKFLEGGLKHHGAGIPTLVCMLAVESGGEFPPMDRKFAAGLAAKGKVTQAERKLLTGKNPSRFAKIYIEKVLPVWRNTRLKFSAEDADNYWGNAGSNDG